MEYHYKAFISYRHAELDTKVAVEIQNRIERYIIPGSIRRELGIKSIGRVFRDKDELPSTSDLNDNIKNAIINSEYLICICSPRYIEQAPYPDGARGGRSLRSRSGDPVQRNSDSEGRER